MRPWNGSLTISRGHPEKPVEMRLVLAEMAKIRKHGGHAAENAWLSGSAVEEIFVCLAWCMLHVMKDSSVMPSIFDEAMKWLVDNIKGTPWEASWNTIGISRNDKKCKNGEHAAENAWLTGSAVEEIICLFGLMHASCDEGLKCHAIHFRWGHEMARWQYQGDTLRSQLKYDWYWQKWQKMQKWWTCSGKCLIDWLSCGRDNLFVWLDACFMWWRTQVSCHPFSMRPWNGSLTISRGHPEKPVEMRLVLAEMAKICKNGGHAAENAWLTGSAVEEIFVCLAWCMLHVMKDSSVMPSIFDEAMKWLADNIKGTPWEASWNAFGISRNGKDMQKWWTCSWKCLIDWLSCRRDICLLGLTHAPCDEGLKCHAIHFRWGHEMARWQYQGDTLRSQLKCVW